jgi:hypothetical protein
MRGIKTLLYTTILFLICGTAVFLAMCIKDARAHDHQRPDLDQWFRTLYSDKGPCCDSGEASRLEDVDWSVEGDCKQFAIDEQNKEPGHYCVHISLKPGAPKEWIRVPDKAVVKMPNHAGPAYVWPILAVSGEMIGIRCFIIGTLA